MEVRELKNEEVHRGLQFVWKVFKQYEAPDYCEEGINTFHEIIQNPDFIGDMRLYGAFEGENIYGAAATRSGGNHISLFFVDGSHHRKGIGKKLFKRICGDNVLGKITVNSSPYAVDVYRHLGFIKSADEQVDDGIRYTPMYHIERYFMEAERLGFSKWTSEDLFLARRLWGDADVTRYICSGGKFSDDDIKNRLALEIKNDAECGVQYWPFFCKKNGEFIGACGLRPFKDEKGCYEIGFHLKKEYWGMGYASESAAKVIEYAFKVMGARKIYAGHHSENKSSENVIKKLGFKYIGDNFYEPTGLYHPSYEMDKGVDNNEYYRYIR